jgi:hypothetical protein
MLVDPVQFFFEPLRRETHGPKNANASGLAYGYDHIAAVGKGKYRYFQAQLFTKISLHNFLE